MPLLASESMSSLGSPVGSHDTEDGVLPWTKVATEETIHTKLPLHTSPSNAITVASTVPEGNSQPKDDGESGEGGSLVANSPSQTANFHCDVVKPPHEQASPLLTRPGRIVPSLPLAKSLGGNHIKQPPPPFESDHTDGMPPLPPKSPYDSDSSPLSTPNIRRAHSSSSSRLSQQRLSGQFQRSSNRLSNGSAVSSAEGGASPSRLSPSHISEEGEVGDDSTRGGTGTPSELHKHSPDKQDHKPDQNQSVSLSDHSQSESPPPPPPPLPLDLLGYPGNSSSGGGLNGYNIPRPITALPPYLLVEGRHLDLDAEDGDINMSDVSGNSADQPRSTWLKPSKRKGRGHSGDLDISAVTNAAIAGDRRRSYSPNRPSSLQTSPSLQDILQGQDDEDGLGPSSIDADTEMQYQAPMDDDADTCGDDSMTTLTALSVGTGFDSHRDFGGTAPPIEMAFSMSDALASASASTPPLPGGGPYDSLRISDDVTYSNRISVAGSARAKGQGPRKDAVGQSTIDQLLVGIGSSQHEPMTSLERYYCLFFKAVIALDTYRSGNSSGSGGATNTNAGGAGISSSASVMAASITAPTPFKRGAPGTLMPISPTSTIGGTDGAGDIPGSPRSIEPPRSPRHDLGVMDNFSDSLSTEESLLWCIFQLYGTSTGDGGLVRAIK
jgi:hypothetical protein